MSHEAIFEVLSGIAMAESTAYWLVAGLTVPMFVIMRTMLPVKGLTIAFLPGLFWGGLSGIYAFRSLGVRLTSDKNSELLATAAVGMIVALLLMLLLVRLIDSAMRIRRPLSNAAVRARA